MRKIFNFINTYKIHKQIYKAFNKEIKIKELIDIKNMQNKKIVAII